MTSRHHSESGLTVIRVDLERGRKVTVEVYQDGELLDQTGYTTMDRH